MEKILSHKRQIAFCIFLVFLLALVRALESFFYDPFLIYFKGDYMRLPFPEYSSVKLFFSLFLRYSLNSIISLAIIQILFKDFMLTKFASVLYLFLFIILIIAFFSIIGLSDKSNNFLLFYVRRFLIQPLFVLLFVPAFYYQNQISRKNNNS
ncbi:exosortase F system-associated protein [uncultured Flavobacterium sp.]|uniref:exosortase F system-associated membrane protein n=1 Tax=uncultured Flavobacterium sp. TaxID=165435 RepID=UPI0025DEC9E5|nr:exosortase F system-associated protein [uncultured Flavobacterium sp.]